MTYPSDYKITKAPRDPMKQVLRSYSSMQEEKDNRVYSALDAALRGDMFRNVEPRWVEWIKLFLAIIPFPERRSSNTAPPTATSRRKAMPRCGIAGSMRITTGPTCCRWKIRHQDPP